MYALVSQNGIYTKESNLKLILDKTRDYTIASKAVPRKIQEKGHVTAYESLLTERLRDMRGGMDGSLTAFCRASRGAFPTQVRAVLDRLGLESESDWTDQLPARETPGNDRHDAWPEPSPANYEWRFTLDTARELADRAAQSGSPILCLGTPTVFAALRHAGADAVLIDRNELLFRSLSRFGTERLVHRDVTTLHALGWPKRFAVAVVDPPWYMEHMRYWIRQLSHLVTPDAHVFLALFPELLRPQAGDERATLCHELGEYGDLSVEENALLYETPPFENETMAAHGVCLDAPWRCADLISLQLRKALVDIVAPEPEQERWISFRYGMKVVNVREDLTLDSTPLHLTSLYGDGSYLVHSVSARQVPRRAIGLWTSRNRAVRVSGGGEVLVTFLSDLAHGVSPSAAIDALATDASERASLEFVLALIGV